jgi:hypothetical protein
MEKNTAWIFHTTARTGNYCGVSIMREITNNVISSRIQRLSSAHSEQVKALKIWRYCKFE